VGPAVSPPRTGNGVSAPLRPIVKTWPDGREELTCGHLQVPPHHTPGNHEPAAKQRRCQACWRDLIEKLRA